MEDIKEVALRECKECGMSVVPGEYHPYAACLMFKACHSSDVVRANLDAVIARGAAELQKDAEPVGWAHKARPGLVRGDTPHPDDTHLWAPLYTHPQPKAATVPQEYLSLIANLAAVVRVQNSNKHADTNSLLEHADRLLSAAPSLPAQSRSIIDADGLPKLMREVIETKGSPVALERLYAFINDWSSSLPAQSTGLHAPAHVLDVCGLSYEQCAEIGKHHGIQPNEVDLIVKEAIRVTGHTSLPAQSEGEQK